METVMPFSKGKVICNYCGKTFRIVPRSKWKYYQDDRTQVYDCGKCKKGMTKESPIIVTSYTGESCIQVQEASGKEYMYTGVLPATKKEIDGYMAKRWYGKAWNLLKQHTRMKKGSDE